MCKRLDRKFLIYFINISNMNCFNSNINLLNRRWIKNKLHENNCIENSNQYNRCRACNIIFKKLSRSDKLSLGLSSVSSIDNVCKKCIRKGIKKGVSKSNKVRQLRKIVKKKEFKKCSICLEDIRTKSKWEKLATGRSTIDNFPIKITLICGHTFHSKCILKWLNDNDTCPNCRMII